MPSSVPAPGPRFVTLPKRPTSEWLLDYGFAFECGMRPDYDCDGCAEAGKGRACDEHRVPGVGVSRYPDFQEAAYMDVMGHAPPVSDSPQWTWKKTKNGPSALEVAA